MATIIGKARTSSLVVCSLCAFLGSYAESSGGAQRAAPIRPHCTFELSIAQRDVVLEEKVPFKLRLTFDQSSYSLTNITAPTIAGVAIEQLPAAKKGQDVVHGVNCFVYEWDGVLYPQKTGTIVIEPFQVAGEQRSSGMRGVWSVFTSNSVAFLSNAVSLRVHALPGDGNVGKWVGDFHEAHLEAERTRLSAGDAIMVRYRIKGSGNLHLCKHPHLQLPEGCKWYAAQAKKEHDGHCFEYVVQLLEDGVFVLPSQMFRYFNPARNGYEELLTESIRLFVDPAHQVKAMQPPLDDVVSESQISESNSDDVSWTQRTSLVRTLELPDWLFLLIIIVSGLWGVGSLLSGPLGGLYQRCRGWYARRLLSRRARSSIIAAKKTGDISLVYQAFKELESLVDWENMQKRDENFYGTWRIFWQRMEAVKFDVQRTSTISDELLGEACQWVTYFETMR